MFVKPIPGVPFLPVPPTTPPLQGIVDGAVKERHINLLARRGVETVADLKAMTRLDLYRRLQNVGLVDAIDLVPQGI